MRAPSAIAQRTALGIHGRHACEERQLLLLRRLSVVTAAAAAASEGGGGGERGRDWWAGEARRAARVAAGKVEGIFQDVKHSAEEVLRRGQSSGGLLQERMEEMAFALQSAAREWERRYEVRERVRAVGGYVQDRVHAADSRYRIRQTVRSLGLELRTKWPSYRQRLLSFLDTRLGRLLSTLLFVWCVLSGWIFKALVLSMWLLPVVAPLLIGTIARNSLIEGACPNCQAQFLGIRTQVIVCRSCRNVVWQPRDDFSARGDPRIIDIDVDNKDA